MTFVQAIRAALQSYATFTGVARRPEFWWFALFTVLGHAALNALNIFTPDGTVYIGSSLSGLFGVAMFLPLLAVTVRRLRDAGRTWSDLFWLLLPIAGLIVVIVHLCEPSRLQPAVPTDAQTVATAV